MKPRVRTAISLVLVIVLFCVLAVGPISCTTAEKPASVGGIWRFELTPVYDYDEDAQRAATTAKPATYEVWLYDYNGAVAGFSGPFQFQGTADGDKVHLEVLQAGGARELSHEANLDLVAVDKETLSGTSIDGDLGHEHRGLGVSKITAKRIKDAPPLSSLHSPSWVKAIMELILSWAPGTWYFKNPMNFTFTGDVTLPIKVGGGYYMMDNTGPGDAHLATWTVYYPLEWSHCGTRKYHFTVKSSEKLRSIDKLADDINKLGKRGSQWLGYKDGVKALVSDVRDFHSRFGDFAITLAQSDYSHNYSLYISLKDKSTAAAAKKHRLIDKIKKGLNLDYHGNTRTLYVNAGTKMESDWTLRRPAVIVDGTAMMFLYLIGNIEVEYE